MYLAQVGHSQSITSPISQMTSCFGHDGPGHAGIAEGKTKARPLTVYHGKVGRGLSVEMSVKHGPVTLLSVVESKEHGFKLLVAEGR